MKSIIFLISLSVSTFVLSAQGIFPFKEKASGKFGYKDQKGKTVVPAKYDFADSLKEGFGAVNLGGKIIIGPAKTEGGKWGFVDEKGKEIIAPQYDHFHPFSEGLAAVDTGGLTNEYGVYVGHHWGYIDRYNTVIIPLIFDFAKGVREDVIILNSDGEYDALGEYSGDGSGTWYGFDKAGQELFSFNCKDMNTFSDGMAKIFDKGKFGFINKLGKEIIPVQFTEAEDFKNGEAKVKKEGSEYFVDVNGVVIP